MSRKRRASRRRAGKPSPKKAPGAAAAASPRRRGLFAAAAAALAGFLAHLSALDHPFVYDDLRTVVDNPSIREPGNLGALLAFERFRPLTNITYALDHALWGLRPSGFHLTGLVLHALAAALVVLVVRAALGDARRRTGAVLPAPAISVEPPALLAGLLFAVHPLMTQAVGYVSGRSEVLCTVFFLLALLVLRAFLMRGGAARLTVGLVLFLLAVAAREVGAMLPFVLLLWDAVLLDGDPAARRRRWLRFHLPFAGATAVAGLARLALFLRDESTSLPRAVWQNVMSQWEIIWRYLGLLVAPVSQSVVHPTQRVETLWDPRALTAGAALVAVVVAAFVLRRRWPVVTLGAAWFLLLLAPSSSFIPLNELMAEHRVYGASCGLFLVVAAAVDALLARRRRWARPLGVVAVAVLVALTVATRSRYRVWADPVSLWTDAAAKAPLTWRAVFGAGKALHDRGECAAAVPYYERAVEVQPGHLESRMNLGICLAELRRFAAARQVFAGALELDPGFVKAYNNLGRLSLLTGDSATAERLFHEALEHDPQNVTARLNLIVLYQQQNRDPRRIRQLCEAVAAVAPGAPGIAECLRSTPRS